MLWLLASPGHQQQWYWLCRIAGPCLAWARISTTFVMSMWSNDIKCKYMFMFPLGNSAHKELTSTLLLYIMMCNCIFYASLLCFILGPTATQVGPTLSQCRDDSTDIGPTLALFILLSRGCLLVMSYCFFCFYYLWYKHDELLVKPAAYQFSPTSAIYRISPAIQLYLDLSFQKKN